MFTILGALFASFSVRITVDLTPHGMETYQMVQLTL